MNARILAACGAALMTLGLLVGGIAPAASAADTPAADAPVVLGIDQPTAGSSCHVSYSTRGYPRSCWQADRNVKITFDYTGDKSARYNVYSDSSFGKMITDGQPLAHPTVVWLAAGQVLAIQPADVTATSSSVEPY